METQVKSKLTVDVITHSEPKEIELPYYSKDNCHARAIISKDLAISVCHSEPGLSITRLYSAGASYRSDEPQCTKEEFDKIYQQVAMKLALLII